MIEQNRFIKPRFIIPTLHPRKKPRKTPIPLNTKCNKIASRLLIVWSIINFLIIKSVNSSVKVVINDIACSGNKNC